VDAAHRRIASRAHPDRWIEAPLDEQEAVRQRFEEVNEAYRVLKAGRKAGLGAASGAQPGAPRRRPAAHEHSEPAPVSVVVTTEPAGAGGTAAASQVFVDIEDDPVHKVPSALVIAAVAVAVVVVLLFTWPFLVGGGFLLAGILVPIAALAVLGLVIWWLVSGASPEGEPRDVAKQALLGVGVLIGCAAIFAGGFIAAAAGGGAIAASLVIAAGLVLVVGAFAGRARWLVLPALSLAMAVGIVSAAGIDFDGGFGEREYRPTASSDIRDRYELAAGELVVDLRGTDLPAGDTPITVDVGMGEATVLVPEDVCVASRAEIGVGLIEVFDRENAGADVDWEDLPRAAEGNSRVVLDANVGMGHVQVVHDTPFRGFEQGRFDGSFDGGGRAINTGCEASTLSAGGR